MKRNKKRNKSIILRFFILIFCAYFTVTLAGLWKELDAKNKELTAAIKQHEALLNDVEQLKSLLNSDNNSEIIEKAARERLGYIFSDEQLFVDVSGD